MARSNYFPQVGRSFWEDVRDDAQKRFDDLKEFLQGNLYQDGGPPFSVEASPRRQYEKLLALRAAGDPAYVQDPSAAKRLEELAALYGPPPDSLYPSPFEPPGGIPPPYTGMQ